MMAELPLHRPALYNPALWSRAEVKNYFVARTALLDRFVDDLRREQPGTRPQHRLVLGLRGMGKSTLLHRLAIAVEDDADLHGLWLPLTFPEEQYNVASLADFWLNCLDALGDLMERRGDADAVAALDAEVEALDRKNPEGALKALLQAAKRLDRRLLLLVDNIDLILARLKKEDWALREALQAHPDILLVGASARAMEATYDYGAAFYDFFKIDELRGLTEAEMRDTILNLARRRGVEAMILRALDEPGRLRVLHTLTGGNPRTAVLLYGVLLKGMDGDVRSDLEGLLDEVTPLYKARFEELPPLSQQLMDKLALHWDPMSARQLAEVLGWEVNLVSAQLTRLIEIGVVEKVKPGQGKRAAFQVGERFFNIWYLMRASRRVRRKLVWFVDFLRVFYSTEELRRAARNRLTANGGDVKDIPDDAPNWTHLGSLLQVTLAPTIPKVRFFAAATTLAMNKGDEALSHIAAWFQNTEDSAWMDLDAELAGLAMDAGFGGDLLRLMDESGAGERRRPLREALAAAVAGDPGLLNGVAPEVRAPALEILADIAPGLVIDTA